MAKKVTMQMIADSLQITKVSVSKALSNRPGVSNELRAKVQDRAREMGYVRKPRSGESAIKHLGFLEPRKYFLESGDFFTQVYYHLLQLCTSGKIRLHLAVLTEEDVSNNHSLPFPFDQQSVDGLFVGGEVRPNYLEALNKHQIPTVAIGFYEQHNAVDAVIVDDYYNSNQITNALIEMGHREIGFLGDRKDTHSSLDRYYGYLKALDENGLCFDPEWHISDVDEHGRLNTDYQLPEKLPSAFVCHSDFAAYHLRLKLEKRGLSVPEDVTLGTFDNSERAVSAGAAVRLDVTGARFAEKALERMAWRVMHPQAEHQRIVLTAPLIVDR